MQAKLQRAQHELEKYTDAVNRVQCGVKELQVLAQKDSADLRRHMKKHWAKICQHLGRLLAKRGVDVGKDQIRESSVVAGLYVQSLRDLLNRVKQLVYEPLCVGYIYFEKLCSGSGEGAEHHIVLVRPGNTRNDARAGSSLAFC